MSEASDFSDDLMKMGFKGSQIRRLQLYIVDKESYQSFMNFIYLNEECRMSKVLLIHNFIEHIQSQKSFNDSEEFVTKFQACETSSEKESLIQKLLVAKAEQEVLKKVASMFDKGDINSLYNAVVESRKMYNPAEILVLLDKLSD